VIVLQTGSSKGSKALSLYDTRRTKMVVCIGKQLIDTEGKSGRIYHIEYNGTFRVTWNDGTKTLHPITQAPESVPLQKIDLVQLHKTSTTPTPAAKPQTDSPPLAPYRESIMTYPKGETKI
jgi:hypothetical protein